MKEVTINIPDNMEKETAEFLLNYESYLSISGKYPYHKCNGQNSSVANGEKK